MIGMLLAAALSVTDAPVALLRVDAEQSSFTVKVAEDRAGGYQIAIDCIEGCTEATHYREITGDTPLGLFSEDRGDLIFSIWATGSVYRVRVWSVSKGAVRKVAELSSRGRPDFLTAADGELLVQTYEADSGVAPPHRVGWKFEGGRFVRKGAQDN